MAKNVALSLILHHRLKPVWRLLGYSAGLGLLSLFVIAFSSLELNTVHTFLIGSSGAAPTPTTPSIGELRTNGLFSVTDSRYSGGADPTGVRDSTNAFQAAMDDAYHHTEENVETDVKGAVFVPPGTYLISRSLYGLNDRRYARGRAHLIIGSTRNGNRPKIVLKANTFNDGNDSNNDLMENKHALFHFWACTRGSIDQEIEDEDSDSKDCDPSYEEQLQSPSDGSNAMNMASGLRNLDIIIKTGNPDAIAVRFAGAQDNILNNIKITFEGAGFAGIYSLIGTNSVVENIEINGGMYGIHGGKSKWPSFANITLRNQTKYAITGLNSAGPFAISGFRIIKQTAPAISDYLPRRLKNGNIRYEYSYYTGSHSGGAYALSDGMIEFAEKGTTQPVIDNTGGRQITMQDVYIKNSPAIVVKNPNGDTTFPGSSTWIRMAKYAYLMPNNVGIRIINGSRSSNNLSEITAVTNLPTNLMTSHASGILAIPSPDILIERSKSLAPDTVNVTDRGIVPVQSEEIARSLSAVDHTQAIQAIIDTPGVTNIFFPKGIYLISDTLRLKKNTRIVGVSNFLTQIWTHERWKPTSTATLISTPNDASAKPVLAFIRLRWHAQKYRNYFTAINWQSGKHSVVYNILLRPLNSTSGVYGTAKSDVKITNNGGGRWYGLGIYALGNTKKHLGYRGLLVDRTAQPLTIYGLDPEDGQGDWQVEIRNSQNVAIRGFKAEDTRNVRVANSSNVYVQGIGGMTEWEFFNTNNVLALNFAAKFHSGKTTEDGRYLIKEVYDSKSVTLSKSTALASLERGIIDFSVWDYNVPVF